MATIDDGDPYTMGLTVAFGHAFRALGGEVSVAARIEKKTTDMTDILDGFAAAGPDGIFFPLFEAEGAHFAEQAQEQEGLESATLIASHALLAAGFLALPQSAGVYFAGPEPLHGANVNAATGKNGDAILSALRSRYGEPATPYWAHAYDAATLLLSSIEAVAVEQGGRLYVDRAGLRAQIGATTGFLGITGELSCDDFGDCGSGRLNIYHHTDLSITDPTRLPVVYRFAP